MATEEWETASESSDVLDRRDSKNDIKDNRDKRDRDPKKSFSGQRPQNDRGNRRMNSSDQRGPGNNSNKNYDHPKNFHKERIAHSSQTKHGYTSAPKNGLGGGKRPPHNLGNKKENTGNQVFRVEGVVPADQGAIDNAINNSYNDK